MAKRYQTIGQQKTLSGKIGYLPNRYPSLAPRNDDYYIIARAEDRLDLIAQDFYDDSTLWWVVAMANDVPGDSMFVTPGFQLRIPGNASNALSVYENENSEL